MPSLLLALPLVAFQDLTPAEHYDLLSEVERITPEARVVQAVVPSVVFIETEYTQSGRGFWGPWERKYEGSGSGVVIHEDGYVVTNYHVVRGADASSLQVSFEGDPQKYEARLVSFVQSEDLALLKIDSPGPFPTVRLGTSSDLWPAERVVAIGNPYGQTHTVSTGIISGLHRNVEIPDQNLAFSDLIQTDASINLGNSGGPLLNIRGELIGINTAMNRQAENIGFAIPVDRVREVLSDILFPQAQSSWLGFDLATNDAPVVGRVWEESPAALAGICEGDRILAVAGEPVRSQDEYLHATLELEPEEPVELTLQRAQGAEKVRLVSWDRIDGMLFERLGLTVREVVLDRAQWVLVDRVRAGGPADGLGLREGDLIPAVMPAVGRYPRAWKIRSRAALAEIVGDLKPGAEVAVDVYRDDNRDNVYGRDELYKGSLTLP